jgi:hypothetical protein
LASQILHILESGDLPDSLRARGLQRAKKFTWQESARRHLEIYSQFLGIN